MSQESSYIKRQSYNSPTYTNNPYKNATQFRYSTQSYPTSVPSRRYATLEESEAVLPVFNTPSNMYLQQEYNTQRYPQPQPHQQNPYNMYSNQQNYNQNLNSSSPYTNDYRSSRNTPPPPPTSS